MLSTALTMASSAVLDVFLAKDFARSKTTVRINQKSAVSITNTTPAETIFVKSYSPTNGTQNVRFGKKVFRAEADSVSIIENY
jgi:hypothetical protein